MTGAALGMPSRCSINTYYPLNNEYADSICRRSASLSRFSVPSRQL
jgi:hypothetical protein